MIWECVLEWDPNIPPSKPRRGTENVPLLFNCNCPGDAPEQNNSDFEQFWIDSTINIWSCNSSLLFCDSDYHVFSDFFYPTSIINSNLLLLIYSSLFWHNFSSPSTFNGSIFNQTFEDVIFLVWFTLCFQTFSDVVELQPIWNSRFESTLSTWIKVWPIENENHQEAELRTRWCYEKVYWRHTSIEPD